MDTDRFVKDPSQLIALCREVIALLSAQSDDAVAIAWDAQLKAIAKAIEQLERSAVAVPDPLRAEKTRLAAALSMHADARQRLAQVTHEFEDILAGLRERIDARQPSGNQKSKATRNHKGAKGRPRLPKTPPEVLRRLIIEALTQLGGSAHKRDLYKKIAENHEGNFLPGDFERLPDGKRIVWKNYCDWEGTLMRKEGLQSFGEAPAPRSPECGHPPAASLRTP
jgi:hypothetical protein